MSEMSSSDVKKNIDDDNRVDLQKENSDSQDGDGKAQFGLQRTLGLTGAISFNLGTMIGKILLTVCVSV